MLSSVQRAEGQSDGCLSVTWNYEDTTRGAVPADQGCVCAEKEGGGGAVQHWCRFWSLVLNCSLSCLMRSRDEHSGLTHAPCALQLFLPLFADNIFPLCCIIFLNHTPLSYISTHANGTLSQSSLRSSVCNDGSHQWLHWMCIWKCLPWVQLDVFEYVCVFLCGVFFKLVGERQTNASVCP